MHQTAYKGLLRLSGLFAGIQEEATDHGIVDVFSGGSHFYARHPIIGL
jgi:hypothetical protein